MLCNLSSVEIYAWPDINIMYSNTDQFTMKTSELLELVKRKKPYGTAICHVKPKKLSKQTEVDDAIRGCCLYPLNLGSDIG